MKLSSRNEASTIPNLLIAPNERELSDIYNAADGDSRGYYEDGAYIASRSDQDHSDGSSAHSGSMRSEPDSYTYIDASVFFHASLVQRFERCRQQVRNIPPIPDIQRTPSAWSHRVLNFVPQPQQIAFMSQDTVQGLLRDMPVVMRRAHWLKGDGARGYRLSTWLWALLAKLDLLETLSSEEVSDIRELGKRAGALALGLDVDARGPDQDLEVSENEGEAPSSTSSKNSEERLGRSARTTRHTTRRRNSSSSVSSDDDLAAVKCDTLLRLELTTAKSMGEEEQQGEEDPPELGPDMVYSGEESLMATVDMVLTVVGECYGQRDLLVARDRLWQQS